MWIKISAERNKNRKIIFMMILIIASGIDLFFIFNLYNIFGVGDYETKKNYTIDYSQGTGGIKLGFYLSHNVADQFSGNLVFRTTSSGDVEVVGISTFNFNVYRDEYLSGSGVCNFTEPVEYYNYPLIINAVEKNHNLSCRGDVDVKFDVGGVIQNETIHFEISIIMPIDPIEIRNLYDISLFGVEILLIIILIAMIGYIGKIIISEKRKSRYPEEMKKRDEKFWDYIHNKSEELGE